MGIESLRSFKSFLIAVDNTSESELREILFTGKDYIDTPGYYHREKSQYKGVLDFYEQNMGREELDRLFIWYLDNLDKVERFMNLRKGMKKKS